MKPAPALPVHPELSRRMNVFPALLLIVILVFPSPSFALHPMEPEPGSRVAAGLEEKLLVPRPSTISAGLEESKKQTKLPEFKGYEDFETAHQKIMAFAETAAFGTHKVGSGKEARQEVNGYFGEAMWAVWTAIEVALSQTRPFFSRRGDIQLLLNSDLENLAKYYEAHYKPNSEAVIILPGTAAAKWIDSLGGAGANAQWLDLFGNSLSWEVVHSLAEQGLIASMVEVSLSETDRVGVVLERPDHLMGRVQQREPLPHPTQLGANLSGLGARIFLGTGGKAFPHVQAGKRWAESQRVQAESLARHQGPRSAASAGTVNLREELLYPAVDEDPQWNDPRFVLRRVATLLRHRKFPLDPEMPHRPLVRPLRMTNDQAKDLLAKACLMTLERPFATEGDVETMIQEALYFLNTYPDSKNPIQEILDRIDKREGILLREGKNLSGESKFGLAVALVVDQTQKGRMNPTELRDAVLRDFGPPAAGLEEERYRIDWGHAERIYSKAQIKARDHQVFLLGLGTSSHLLRVEHAGLVVLNTNKQFTFGSFSQGIPHRIRLKPNAWLLSTDRDETIILVGKNLEVALSRYSDGLQIEWRLQPGRLPLNVIPLQAIKQRIPPQAGLEEGGIEKLERMGPIVESIIEEITREGSFFSRVLQKHQEEIEAVGIPYEQLRSLLLGPAEAKTSDVSADGDGRVRFTLFIFAAHSILGIHYGKMPMSLPLVLLRTHLLFQELVTSKATTKEMEHLLGKMLTSRSSKAEVKDMVFQTLRLFGIPARDAGLEEKVPSLAARERVEWPLRLALERAQDGIIPTIIGKDLLGKMSALRVVLAGHQDQNIFLDDGDLPTLLSGLMSKGIRDVVFVGLKEESKAFEAMAKIGRFNPPHLIVADPEQPDAFFHLILEILSRATSAQESTIRVRAEFQELMVGLEQADSQA